jgi:hypothetical protein
MSGVAGLGLAGTAFADDGGPSTVDGTPCTPSARACVDLDDQKAWLIEGAKVTRGPVPISSGGDGKATPAGTFHVLSKNKDQKSNEFKMPNGQPAPMPYSVFFAPGGIAFHAGDPAKASAGCIHLNGSDAVAFFNTLQVGNEVQVHGSGTGPSPDDHGRGGDDHGDDHGDDDGGHGGGDGGDDGGD